MSFPFQFVAHAKLGERNAEAWVTLLGNSLTNYVPRKFESVWMLIRIPLAKASVTPFYRWSSSIWNVDVVKMDGEQSVFLLNLFTNYQNRHRRHHHHHHYHHQHQHPKWNTSKWKAQAKNERTIIAHKSYESDSLF